MSISTMTDQRRKYTEDDYDEWERLYTDEDLTTTEIGERWGTGHTTIYKRLRSRGVKMRLHRGRTEHERYLDMVDVDAGPGDCWGWTGASNEAGYSLFKTSAGKGAHRYSYEFHHGSIPEDHVVRHLCHNRACTNPDHLDVGTHQENMDDRVAYVAGLESEVMRLRARLRALA